MNLFAAPWLELLVFIPMLTAAYLAWGKPSFDLAHRISTFATLLTLVFALASWIDFAIHDRHALAEPTWLMSNGFGRPIWVVDELSAPLLPIVALLFFLTVMTTLQTQSGRFSFAAAMMLESLTLAAMSTPEPWIVWAATTIAGLPVLSDLRLRRSPTRLFILHWVASVALVGVGLWLTGMPVAPIHAFGLGLLTLGILIRAGIFPFHLWVSDLYDRASFGSALLYTAPLLGSYLAVRTLLPIAPDFLLRVVGTLALGTAVLASALAIVQTDPRRFFACLFLGHAALVLAGLETNRPIALAGSLYVWPSILLSLGGLALTLRAVEGRVGRLRLDQYHGLHEHAPMIAGCFLITGLASVGFPGTIGFVGGELLVDGIVDAYPTIGIAIVVAATLNGFAILQAYFRIFTGTRYVSSLRLSIRRREVLAVCLIPLLIVAGGLYPQPGIASRYHAAKELLHERSIARGEPNLDAGNDSPFHLHSTGAP